MEIVFVVGIIGIFVVAIVVGNRKIHAQRKALTDRIETQRARIAQLTVERETVDGKTSERVRWACLACEEKFAKALSVSQRARDRDFARAHRVLDQVDAKLDNAQGGLQRAHERMAAQQQRKEAAAAERAAQRAEQRAAEKAARMAERTGAFGTRTRLSSRSTDWSAVPTQERGVCFFCSRPSYLRELTPVTVTLDGVPQRVLACPQDRSIVLSGGMPRIRAFDLDGQRVPWYAYGRYNPYHDYYASDYDDFELGIDLYDLGMIASSFFQPAQPAWQGDYVMTPDSEVYRDFYSGEAAGAVSYDSQGMPLPVDPTLPGGDPIPWPPEETVSYDGDES